MEDALFCFVQTLMQRDIKRVILLSLDHLMFLYKFAGFKKIIYGYINF